MASGLTYLIGRGAYVALTNRTNAVSLIASRGAGFEFGKRFVALPPDFEPTAAEVLKAVEGALAGSGVDSVAFAGAGEPLLRLGTLEEASSLIAERHDQLPLRVVTNGLVLASSAAEVAARLRAARVASASVALASADPEQYQSLMRPEPIQSSTARSSTPGLQEVCGFITSCVAAGISVECTTVAAPGVDLEAAHALARKLGAGFRERSFHP